MLLAEHLDVESQRVELELPKALDRAGQLLRLDDVSFGLSVPAVPGEGLAQRVVQPGRNFRILLKPAVHLRRHGVEHLGHGELSLSGGRIR